MKTAASSMSHAAEMTASTAKDTAKAVGRAATLVGKRPGPLPLGLPHVSTVEFKAGDSGQQETP